MRLLFFTALLALSCAMSAQLEVQEIQLEPTKEDSAVFLFQEKYKDYLAAKNTPTILYFCPTRNYKKEEYSEKIATLKGSPFLKNLNKKVNLFLIYFRENEVNDMSGVKIKDKKWVNESTCFFMHFPQANLERLATNFPREYRIEDTDDAASTKVILFDANRCFPDVPSRIGAYARAIQESLQPNYSETEVNQFQQRVIEDLQKTTNEAQKKTESISQNVASQGEQIFAIQENAKVTSQRIDNLQSTLSDTDILLQAFSNFNTAANTNGVDVTRLNGSGWFLGVRKRIHSKVFIASGISLSTQKANLELDSLLVENTRTDKHGVSYQHRSYYNDVTQSIAVSSMSIPISIQYHYTPNVKSKWKLIGDAGIQAHFIQEAQSQITGGSLSTAGLYEGFNQEIRNVSELGFADNQALVSEPQTDLFRDNSIGLFCSLQFEWRLSSMLHINANARLQTPGNWLKDADSSNSYVPITVLSAYGQNPFQLGLGLTYSLKQ